nr:hypothetical protein [Solirubrobacterales bacterium]
GRERRGVALVLAGPAVAGGLVQAALFPEGGTDRFAATAFWPMLLACLAALALVDPRRRVLLVAGGLYVAMLVAAFALPSPVGQNALRPGALLGLPLLVLAARPRSAPYVAVVGAVLLYLQWLPAVRAVAEARGDPSTQRAYHAEVVSFLRVHSAPGDRVEVPLTRNHWEAAYLARVVPLARGWHRQLDRKVAPLFYDGRRLSAERYTAWLWRSGVRWVALPAVPLDFSARQEAALLRRGLPALHLVHRSARWTIWRVDGSVPVASGPARVSALRLDGFDLVAHGTGTVIVRERFTPYFRLVRGTGCVRRSRAGWTAVRVDRPGRISVTAKFSAAGALRPARRCRSPDQADAS